MNRSKTCLALAASLLLAASTSHLLAMDAAGKEVTITGSMVCGKCTLHLSQSCENVVQVQKDGKTINYFLVQNDVSKAAHGAVCSGDAEKVTVTGTLVEKDGKEVLTPSKIEPVKS